MNGKKLRIVLWMALGGSAAVIAGACHDGVSELVAPGPEASENVAPGAQGRGRLQEGAIIRARVRFKLGVGLPGNRRELTAERTVEGVMRNGRAIGRITSGRSRGAGALLSYTGDDNAECPECAAELDSLFHNFMIDLATTSVDDAAYTWTGMDASGNTHDFVSSANPGTPAYQVNHYINGSLTTESSMEWQSTDGGWLLRTQDFNGYSDGAVAMTWSATVNQEYIVLNAPLNLGVTLADASAVLKWFLPRALGAQEDDCDDERNELIAASVGLAIILGKVARQRGIPTWGDYRAGVAAATAFGATLANWRSCRRTSGGGGGGGTGGGTGIIP